MANPPRRPGALDLRSKSFDPPTFPALGSSNSASLSMTNLSLADLPSPRAGEVPPALSPLDALAFQGRLLAKRFEQQDTKTGRRLSRLAPLTIQNEFGNRMGYFSSLSSSTNSPSDEPGAFLSRPASSPRQETPDKHKSLYPLFANNDDHHNQPRPVPGPLLSSSRDPNHPPLPKSYFDLPRSHSPESVEPHIGLQEATPVSPQLPAPSSQRFLSPQRKNTADSQSKSQPRSNLLAPKSPGSLYSQRSPALSPSVRSVPADNQEVDDMSPGSSYEQLQPNRSLSPTSSSFRAHSPFSPVPSSFMPRSPSVSSDYSSHGANLPRPSYNFSRPMSRQSPYSSTDMRPSPDVPQRQFSEDSVYMRPSFDSQPRRQDSNDSHVNTYMNETVHTPVSMASEDFRQSGDFTSNPAPSYTYSKFSLPRGRKLDRASIGIEDFFKTQITWDQPNQNQARPPSPDSPPRSFDQPRIHNDNCPANKTSFDRSAPSLASSNSTIRGRMNGAKDITAQQHCDMGLELHEAGELLKSTYHLRLAARAGLPEAMFWYGLACRHGWGMRENQVEALQWLRRAVNSGQLEVADDEDQSKQNQPADHMRKRQHRAQYAVAIYELGKCYGNGWGAPQDKALALRCYEIAGSWGDADALVEAGYCYAEAVGCKKDMKKAAKLYRAAEAKGVSMVGNSWIYKDKYMDESSTVSDARSVRSGRSTKKDNSEKKPRDKSRTRTMFGRKKSYTISSS